MVVNLKSLQQSKERSRQNFVEEHEEFPIRAVQSNQSASTRKYSEENKSADVISIRHVAYQQSWQKSQARLIYFRRWSSERFGYIYKLAKNPFISFILNDTSPTWAGNFEVAPYRKSFLNSVPQFLKSGPSIAGMASLSNSSGVSGSSSFIGTEHWKPKPDGREIQTSKTCLVNQV